MNKSFEDYFRGIFDVLDGLAPPAGLGLWTQAERDLVVKGEALGLWMAVWGAKEAADSGTGDEGSKAMLADLCASYARHKGAVTDQQFLREIGRAILESTDQIFESAPTRKRGRPSVQIATALVREVMMVYERLAGKRATIITSEGKAHGEFLEFLESVFYVMGINASAEARARAVLQEGGHHLDLYPPQRGLLGDGIKKRRRRRAKSQAGRGVITD